MAKLLSYEGLQAFYDLLNEKFIDTTEVNEDKGLTWAVTNQDDVDTGADPIYKAEVKLGDGLEFDDDGNITAAGLSPATDTKLGTIKTYVDTYDEDDNPTGNNVGIEMVASDPDNAPTVLDRAKIVGVEAVINKGQANGYASLDANGLVPAEQLPSFVDDVIEGYYNENEGKFYESFTAGDPEADPATDDTYEDEIEGETGKIYVDVATGASYRYSGSVFVEISSGSFDIITTAEIEALFE